jgi:hypothetical protein
MESSAFNTTNPAAALHCLNNQPFSTFSNVAMESTLLSTAQACIEAIRACNSVKKANQEQAQHNKVLLPLWW